ncbi:hypothetical protein CFOL_v3_07158 [Cephalotus follicularis]|uniref:Integrase zinc-binding domain-containing protein n=1 Tax=Cephalotus follicularis TaxID=3775 RepID=A0A1Q3B6R4_CEPFO|nr:hypothetical protein CFOL_v3_07158 [Cephalotus follicularis]
MDGVLYNKPYAIPFLRCLKPSEADYALREVYKGIYGNNVGKSLFYKILWEGYYWPTMMNNRNSLDLLEELRHKATTKVVAYQQRISRYYNKKVHPKGLKEEEIVLRRARISNPLGTREKLASEWESPYMIKRVFRPL